MGTFIKKLVKKPFLYFGWIWIAFSAVSVTIIAIMDISGKISTERATDIFGSLFFGGLFIAIILATLVCLFKKK